MTDLIKTWRTLARMAAAALVGTGLCLHSLAEEVGSIQSPLATDGSIWETPVIPVCWEAAKPGGSWRNTDAGRAGLGWTRDAVRTTWETVSNVRFTGWEVCDSSSTGIRILVDNDGPHVKKLGNRLDGMRNGMVLNFDFDDWSPTCANSFAEREFCIRAIAVHEFGHALGFSHEHNRSDRRLCTKEPQGTNPTLLITAYDPESVMNYCSPTWSNDGRLSPLDVYGARMMYGPFTAETPMRIQASGTIFARDDETIGSETGSEDFDFEISLTEALPRRVYRREICVGGEVRVVVEIDAAVGPAASEATLNMKSYLYEGRSCATRDEEDRDQSIVALLVGDASQPIRHRLNNGGVGGGDFAEVNFTFSRLVSETDMGDSCPGCRDAADASSFGSQAPKSDPSSLTSAVFLRNLGVEKCLAPAETQSPGQYYLAQIRSCQLATSAGSGDAQKWVFESVAPDRYRIQQTGLENHCLSLRTSRNNREGGNVEIVSCSSHSDQIWQLVEAAPDTFSIRHASANKCLNVHSGRENRENGQVSVYSCADTPDQHWLRISGEAAGILRQTTPNLSPGRNQTKSRLRVPAAKLPEKK